MSNTAELRSFDGALIVKNLTFFAPPSPLQVRERVDVETMLQLQARCTGVHLRRQGAHTLRAIVAAQEGGLFQTEYTLKHGVGRMYAKGAASLQYADKHLRRILLQNIARDVDFVNCNPTIFVYLMAALGHAMPLLTDYILRRSHWLSKFKMGKKEVGAILNGLGLCAHWHEQVKALWSEIRVAVDAFFRDKASKRVRDALPAGHAEDPYAVVRESVWTLENCALHHHMHALSARGFHTYTMIFDGYIVDKRDRDGARFRAALKEANEMVVRQVGIPLVAVEKPWEGEWASVAEMFTGAPEHRYAFGDALPASNDAVINLMIREFGRFFFSVAVHSGDVQLIVADPLTHGWQQDTKGHFFNAWVALITGRIDPSYLNSDQKRKLFDAAKDCFIIQQSDFNDTMMKLRPGEVLFTKGIFDISTGRLRPTSLKDFAWRKLMLSWEPPSEEEWAEMSRTDDLDNPPLKERTQYVGCAHDSELQGVLRKVSHVIRSIFYPGVDYVMDRIGVAMFAKFQMRNFIILCGEGGTNGKSLFFETIMQKTFGETQVFKMDPIYAGRTLSGNNENLATAADAKLNFSEEVQGAALNGSAYKELAGGGALISPMFKYGHALPKLWLALIVLLTNHLPTFTPMDDALAEVRMGAMGMPARFVRDDEDVARARRARCTYRLMHFEDGLKQKWESRIYKLATLFWLAAHHLRRKSASGFPAAIPPELCKNAQLKAESAGDDKDSMFRAHVQTDKDGKLHPKKLWEFMDKYTYGKSREYFKNPEAVGHYLKAKYGDQGGGADVHKLPKDAQGCPWKGLRLRDVAEINDLRPAWMREREENGRLSHC